MHDSANTQRRSINRLVQRGQVTLHQSSPAEGFRDVVSSGAPCGKRVPLFKLETGRSFPTRPLGETATQNLSSKRDTVSQTGLLRKLRPTLKDKTGTQFPDRASKTKLRWNSSWMGWLMPQIGTIPPHVIEGLGCPPSPSYRWRSKKRKARRIQGRTATCLSSLSTAVLALPSERP